MGPAILACLPGFTTRPSGTEGEELRGPVTLFVMLLVAGLCTALFCRYTIRDIGFVDLDGPTYSLTEVTLDGVTGADFAAGDLGRIVDSNVTAGRISAAATADPRVQSAGPAGGWVLDREGLDPILLGGKGLTRDLARERALTSPMRERLGQQLVDAFAVLLVIGEPGPEIAEELRAAREGLGLLSGQLPRPIVRPLAELYVPEANREEERVLLWSLGLPARDGGVATALIYGRGRLAGPVLRGEAIERGELLAQLALVGESCECDTERDWLAEPSIPLAWPGEQRSRMAEDLGFDPASPLVRAEVVRILEREASGPSGDSAGVDDVVFGYRESSLVGDPVSPAPEEESRGVETHVGPESGGASPGPDHDPIAHRPTEGDDWGFSPLSTSEVAAREDGLAEAEEPRAKDGGEAGRSLLLALGLIVAAGVLGAGWIWLRGGEQA